MIDLSHDRRYLCSELVSISFVNAQGRKMQGTGNLEEIGTASAMVHLDSAARVGSPLTLICQGHRLKGVVQDCTKTEFGCFVRVGFQAGTAWTRDQFRPAYLIDPLALPTSLTRFQATA